MKKHLTIAVTADLHFERLERRALVAEFARIVRGTEADVLVIAGDIASGAEYRYDRCLSLFEDFHGKKLAVLGNHDIFVDGDKTSWIRRDELRSTFLRYDFHLLDGTPVVIGGVGFAGNMCWYDYSFFPSENPDPEIRMLLPGTGILQWKDIDNAVLEKKRMKFVLPDGNESELRWPDLNNVDWGASDQRVCEIMADELDEDITELEHMGVERIVTVSHHLPFGGLLKSSRNAGFMYGRAYVGSSRIGAVLRKHTSVKHHVCGHTHGNMTLVDDPLHYHLVYLNERHHVPHVITLEID